MQVLVTITDSLVPVITAERELRNASMTAAGSDAPPIALESEMVLLGVQEMLEQWRARHAEKVLLGLLPVVIDGVPQEVTRRQAIQALINIGRYADVQPCIDLIADAAQRATMQNEWDNSQTFERSRPTLVALATSPAPNGLGMTEPELDELFKLAATL